MTEDTPDDRSPDAILDAVSEQLSTRRSVLAGSGALAGATTLGLLSGSGMAQENDGSSGAVQTDGSGGNGLEYMNQLGTDVDVLNYALTLEHLEDVFYEQARSQYDDPDYKQADALSEFGPYVQNRVFENVRRISQHESAHVDVLTQAIELLGGEPVPECSYNFSYDSPSQFLAVAQALENTGVMAYDGAIALMESPDLQTAAATVATVEARHASYLNLLNRDPPFPAATDDALRPCEILDIAGQFIDDCEYDTIGAGPCAETEESGS